VFEALRKGCVRGCVNVYRVDATCGYPEGGVGACPHKKPRRTGAFPVAGTYAFPSSSLLCYQRRMHRLPKEECMRMLIHVTVT
jgi:hypothetical protein